jgi:hypothetical protein
MLMACLACKCSPRRDAGRTSAGGAALALALVAPLHASAHHGALGGAALALARVAPLHASAHHGAIGSFLCMQVLTTAPSDRSLALALVSPTVRLLSAGEGYWREMNTAPEPAP